MRGLKKLSIIPTIITAHINKPTALKKCPAVYKKIIAGIEIIDVPTEGIKEAIIVRTPQSAGFGTLKIAKPIPINIPCIKATKRVPFITPFIVSVSLLIIF